MFGWSVFCCARARRQAGCPAPRPARGLGDEPGANRVHEDVLDRCRKVLLVVDHPGREALGEERTATVMARVVLPRIVALEPLDCSRKLLGRAVDDRVVVRPHEAIRVESESAADDGPSEEGHEHPPIDGIAKEPRFSDAPSRHVEVAVG